MHSESGSESRIVAFESNGELQMTANLAGNQHLAATARSEGLSELKQSEALLVIFHLAIASDADATGAGLAQRVMLESIVHDAQETDCRILSSFRSRRWRRRLYESLAHLHQSGYISCSMRGYDLTDTGRTRAEGYPLTDTERAHLREIIDNVSESAPI